jgi:hypothetical protein
MSTNTDALPEPITTTPPRRRKVQLVAVLAGALAVVGLAYWLFWPSTFQMDGSINLASGATTYGATTPDGCLGYAGYADMNAGTTVTVFDETGKVVALGELQPGTDVGGLGGCLFPFSIADVPSGSKFYSVEVSHRGRVTITEDVARTGHAMFTLGAS